MSLGRIFFYRFSLNHTRAPSLHPRSFSRVRFFPPGSTKVAFDAEDRPGETVVVQLRAEGPASLPGPPSFRQSASLLSEQPAGGSVLEHVSVPWEALEEEADRSPPLPGSPADEQQQQQQQQQQPAATASPGSSSLGLSPPGGYSPGESSGELAATGTATTLAAAATGGVASMFSPGVWIRRQHRGRDDEGRPAVVVAAAAAAAAALDPSADDVVLPEAVHPTRAVGRGVMDATGVFPAGLGPTSPEAPEATTTTAPSSLPEMIAGGTEGTTERGGGEKPSGGGGGDRGVDSSSSSSSSSSFSSSGSYRAWVQERTADVDPVAAQRHLEGGQGETGGPRKAPTGGDEDGGGGADAAVESGDGEGKGRVEKVTTPLSGGAGAVSTESHDDAPASFSGVGGVLPGSADGLLCPWALHSGGDAGSAAAVSGAAGHGEAGALSASGGEALGDSNRGDDAATGQASSAAEDGSSSGGGGPGADDASTHGITSPGTLLPADDAADFVPAPVVAEPAPIAPGSWSAAEGSEPTAHSFDQAAAAAATAVPIGALLGAAWSAPPSWVTPTVKAKGLGFHRSRRGGGGGNLAKQQPPDAAPHPLDVAADAGAGASKGNAPAEVAAGGSGRQMGAARVEADGSLLSTEDDSVPTVGSAAEASAQPEGATARTDKCLPASVPLPWQPSGAAVAAATAIAADGRESMRLAEGIAAAEVTVPGGRGDGSLSRALSSGSRAAGETGDVDAGNGGGEVGDTPEPDARLTGGGGRDTDPGDNFSGGGGNSSGGGGGGGDGDGGTPGGGRGDVAAAVAAVTPAVGAQELPSAATIALAERTRKQKKEATGGGGGGGGDGGDEETDEGEDGKILALPPVAEREGAEAEVLGASSKGWWARAAERRRAKVCTCVARYDNTYLYIPFFLVSRTCLASFVSR